MAETIDETKTAWKSRGLTQAHLAAFRPAGQVIVTPIAVLNPETFR